MRVGDRCQDDRDREQYKVSQDWRLSCGAGEVVGIVLRCWATAGIMERCLVTDEGAVGTSASSAVTLRWVVGAGEWHYTELERERCCIGDLEWHTIAGFPLDGTCLGGAGGFSLHGSDLAPTAR